MLSGGLESFRGKQVLLLQGPVGPFFARLARDLRACGATVHKVNFHAGDALFYPGGTLFRGSRQEWPAFLEQLLERLRIDIVLLYGDCRPIHAQAHALAHTRGIEVGVFEEGYLRPNHITLERFGVNGYSQIPRDATRYLQMPDLPDVPVREVGNTYWLMVWWGFWYFTIGGLASLLQPEHVHHRKLSVLEALPWLRSVWRKQWYRWTERHLLQELTRRWGKRYFLVPLQVHNDTQIRVHSKFEGVEQFIERVMRSFAGNAPTDTALVIKHHPMDRGYLSYASLIGRLTHELGLQGRCFYLHDQHLPTLLDHARAAVVVNSTVGLQALRHGVPLKAMGEAIYDFQGLTFQGELEAFWNRAHEIRPDKRLLRQFVRYLKLNNQINGSFFRRLPGTGWSCGLDWQRDAEMPEIAVSQPVPLSGPLVSPVMSPTLRNEVSPLVSLRDNTAEGPDLRRHG
ncbi:MAG: capsular biosynthesis protein [Burkholderiales bacterium]|nr:MAG: capsular biosynthesis protein [Burkholderiales bacterium]